MERELASAQGGVRTRHITREKKIGENHENISTDSHVTANIRTRTSRLVCNSKALPLNSSHADMEWNTIKITSQIIRIFSVFTQLMHFVQGA